MRLNRLVALVGSIFIMGCASSGSSNKLVDPQEFAERVNSSPDLIEIDAQLEALDLETKTLEESYNSIQSNVLTHTDLTGSTKDEDDKLIVFINDNNLLVVNDKAMSRNDFSNFAIRNLPALCTPTPKLSIHKKANYDTAAWVLEVIYAHGCTKVDVE
jgi:biopolymer transport protein ExbD